MSEQSEPNDSDDATPASATRWSRLPGRRGSSRGRTPVVSLIARMVVGTAVLVVCVVVVWWWASGGRWFNVRTASMGTYAPVGTLVWVKPAHIHDLHVGDVITFHTPTYTYRTEVNGRTRSVETISQTYTHRVIAVHSDGTVQTKGDLNLAPDPWATDQHHLVGQVVASWPGVGWLIRAFPVLLPGIVGWWVLTALFASKRSRAPLRVVGSALFVALAIYLYNPLFAATELSFLPLGPQGARATYVGTGLMPVQLTAKGVPSVVIHSGQLRSIVAIHPGLHNRYQVNLVPVVPWQTWAIIVAVCLAPAVWSVIVGAEPPPPPRSRRKQRAPRPAPTAPEFQPA